MKHITKNNNRMIIINRAFKIFIFFSILFACFSQYACQKNSIRQKPNVVIVLTDDQGYGDIGAHGSPYVKTPALNKLYKESVRLTNFHVDPCCAPTRAALLTGQYSARSGVWHTIGGRSLLQKDKITIANVFGASGYKTGIFGKWHLGDEYPFRPQDRGFQESVVFHGGVIGSNPDYWGNDYYDDTYFHNGRPEKYKGYCNTIWFEQAIKFIRNNKNHPFLCYIATNVPHAPLRVDEKYIEPYKSMFSDRLANYYGMVTKFDEDFGIFLHEMKDLGLEKNTIVVYMTDNGPCPWFGGIKIDNEGFVVEGYSAGMRGAKIWGYENAHRVPCFIRWPDGGIGGGRDINELTAHFDIFPTLIDLCGLKKPDNINFDGLSLKPLLMNKDVKWPNRAIIVQNQRVDFPVKYKEYQVLTKRWRLVNPYLKEIEDMEKFNMGIRSPGENKYITDTNRYELYDINADPEERKNIADLFPDVVKRLSEKYEEWWDDVSRDFNKFNAIIIGNKNENPTVLYSHDAHNNESGDAVWVIDVDKQGKYQIISGRWPVESGKRIAENKDGSRLIDIKSAYLRIGNIKKKVIVTKNMKLARFTVHLKPGTTCLSAGFSGIAQKFRANYLYVSKIGSADSIEVNKYKPFDPSQLMKFKL